MMIKALLVLAVGALAQNDRVTIQSDCSFGSGAEAVPFAWCVTSNNNVRLNLTGAGVPDAPITVYWNVTEGADGMANIAISNPNTDSVYCSWGISDNEGMPNSAAVIFSPFVNETDRDVVIGDVRVAPTPAPEGEGQIVEGTYAVEQNEDGLFGFFQRRRVIEGFADSRQFSGETYIIAACGNGGDMFFHNLNYVWFQVNVDTGVLTAAAPAEPSAAAAPFGTMTAAFAVAASVVAWSL